ncbi:MAG: polysaccharide deacetylase family protein [Mesorhizobium sp.]
MAGVRIINFHGIGEPQRELEPGEEPYWISVERFRYMLDRIVAHADHSQIAITFDDGNLSDLAIGAVELEKRKLKARFFVLTGRIGQVGSLSENNIRALLSADMGIGSHGIWHRDWSSLPLSELNQELTESKRVLEAICGSAINHAAIPFGRYNARVMKAARAAEYERVYSSDGGSADPKNYLQARSSVRSDTSDAAFEAMLSGRLPWAKRLRRTAAMAVKQIA